MDRNYNWQIQTTKGKHLTGASTPRRTLREWIESGEAKQAIFSCEGLPTVSIDISSPKTRVVFEKVIIPDIARMDCDRSLSLRSGDGGGATGQPRPTNKYQRIGYVDPDGKSSRVWIDLVHGTVELK